VVPETAAEPVAFAAAELSAYLGRMFGRTPSIRRQPGPNAPWLALARPGDRLGPRPIPASAEYAVQPAGEGATVAAASPRALVAAVYALLEAAGCRWSPHGPADEFVPGPGEAGRVPPLEGRPAFRRRAWAADLASWHYSVPDRLAARLPGDVAFIDWMAKTGATGFLFIRHANDTQWTVPELVPELRRRGLALEGGGHALVELLPRALFPTHPEYFPLGPTGRSDLGNVCVSSREALAIVRERAAEARLTIPGAPDLHLWGLDLFGGGWCACPGCAELLPSDQLLRLCNEAADSVDESGRVFHLAYHDTIAAPHLVRPHPRVWAEFAPRERCYAHALDDPACLTNVPYRRALEEHLERFAGRVDVFEYYGDAILFGGCAVPLARVIAGDLAYYERAGVAGVSCLIFGQYSLWAYGVNVETFARGACRPGDAAEAPAHWCARRFGGAAAAMGRYLAALERSMARVVTYGDVLLPPRAAAARTGLDAALAAGPRLRRLLGEAAGRPAPAGRIAAEERLLDYTLGVLAGVRDWLDAGAGDAAERALDALAAAVRHVRDGEADTAGSWGLYDLEITHAFFAAALRARLG